MLNFVPYLAPNKLFEEYCLFLLFCFYTLPQDGAGVLWFHIGVCVSVHLSAHPCLSVCLDLNIFYFNKLIHSTIHNNTIATS